MAQVFDFGIEIVDRFDARLIIGQGDGVRAFAETIRNDRDGLAIELKYMCVRVRVGMKGYFGADSSEYEQAGGTRASERKKPARKAGPVPAPK